jgi:ubiquitin-protein ligase
MQSNTIGEIDFDKYKDYSNIILIDDIQRLEETEYYVINILSDDNIIKMIFNIKSNFYYFESDYFNMNKINTYCSHNKNKLTFDEIIKYLNGNIIKRNIKPSIDSLGDCLNLFRDSKRPSKYDVDFKAVRFWYEQNRPTSDIDITGVPKELLFKKEQIYKMITHEIIKVNSSMEYPHYIIPQNNNPFNLIFVFKYTKGELGKKMETIKEKYGYDHIEILLKINPELYPFIPPKLEYRKPKIDLALLFNLMNLKLFSVGNWNPTISLQWLITNMSSKLEPLFNKHIIVDSEYNSNETISFDNLEYSLINLAILTKEDPYVKLEINFDVNKLTFSESSKKEGKYWSSGVGYGHDGKKEWNIEEYVRLQQNSITNIILNLNKINLSINPSINTDIIFSSVLPQYLINQLRGTNLLVINKNIELFKTIFKILHTISSLESRNQDFIDEISELLKSIDIEVNIFLNSSVDMSLLEENKQELYLTIHCISEWYNANATIEKEVVLDFTIDDKDSYCKMIEDNNFSTYTIPKTHSFIKNKDTIPGHKTMIRIASEVSALKSSLPINWDTSILVRIPEGNLNMLSFIITGPEGTPYHNGVFEFHAYFPNNYPSVPPKVLLETTGGGTVRFNPNLYNSGKVCLSLLGTWSGSGGEKWNMNTSTFLQVLISIQSLILVENPYYNEPGWEKQMHTEEGKKRCFDYTDNIRLQTIRVAINEKIEYPPKSFETFVKEHFKAKKDELIKITQIWVDESKSKKTKMIDERLKMLKLLETI